MKPAHISQHLCPPGPPAEVGSESALAREDFKQVQVLSRTVGVRVPCLNYWVAARKHPSHIIIYPGNLARCHLMPLAPPSRTATWQT